MPSVGCLEAPSLQVSILQDPYKSLSMRLTSNYTLGWENGNVAFATAKKDWTVCYLNAALRTLGIPARPITNFSSAHDADANRAIDYYFDEKGRPMDTSSDSVWLVIVLYDVVLHALYHVKTACV